MPVARVRSPGLDQCGRAARTTTLVIGQTGTNRDFAGAVGFHAACNRLNLTVQTVNNGDAFVTLAEVLWWAVSLDEGYQARDGEGYKRRRDADPDGRLWQGVRFARNRAGHQRLVMTRVRLGAELDVLVLDVSRLDTVTDIVWRPAAELTTDPRHRDLVGRRVYEEALEGRPVLETIYALRRWFDKAAGQAT